MKVDAGISRVLSALPVDVAVKLARIEIQHRPWPTGEDFQRGATPDHLGYFYGAPIEQVETTELPDEALPEGVIVIFTGKIKPFTLANLARAVLHEIAHVLGYDEQTIVEEMGLHIPPPEAA